MLLLAGVAVALAGCGSTNHATTATTTQVTAPAPPKTIAAYFFKDGALTRVPVQITNTPEVATAALNMLLAGPPSGYETALPAGASLTAVTVVDGVATATFSAGLGRPTHSAQGQIVFTLLQFATVRSVSIVVAGIGPVLLQDPAGHDLGKRATKADYVDLTPEALIFVRTPARGSTVSSPVRAAGTANTFEATFQIDIRVGQKLVRTKTITATSGSGMRGTWSATLDLPAGDVTLVFYEASAKDGSHIHTTIVPLQVR
jgi:hypothetical protein